MEYEIVISDTCLEEIEETCYYIEKVLKAEQAANRLREKIIKTIQELKDSPKIYAKIDQKDRTGRDYRRIVINNYVIIYTIMYKRFFALNILLLVQILLGDIICV